MKFDKIKFSLCVRAANRRISTTTASRQEAVFRPDYSFQKQAHISDFQTYRNQHELSMAEPQAFWGSFAKQFHWKKAPAADQFLKYNFDNRKGPIFIKWMEGGQMNVCYNVVDRHVRNGLGDKVAFYW